MRGSTRQTGQLRALMGRGRVARATATGSTPTPTPGVRGRARMRVLRDPDTGRAEEIGASYIPASIAVPRHRRAGRQRRGRRRAPDVRRVPRTPSTRGDLPGSPPATTRAAPRATALAAPDHAERRIRRPGQRRSTRHEHASEVSPGNAAAMRAGAGLGSGGDDLEFWSSMPALPPVSGMGVPNPHSRELVGITYCRYSTRCCRVRGLHSRSSVARVTHINLCVDKGDALGMWCKGRRKMWISRSANAMGMLQFGGSTEPAVSLLGQRQRPTRCRK